MPQYTPCPTKCSVYTVMNWQEKYGVIRQTAITAVVMGAGLFADILVPINSYLVGFIINDEPIPTIMTFNPVNGLTISANQNKALPNALLDAEAFWNRLQCGAGEELVMSQLINYPFCTTDTDVPAHGVRITNNAAVTKKVQPVIIDFSNWISAL